MIKPKLKRGTQLIIKDTGVQIVVERDRQDGTLFVFDENKPIGEQYYDVAIDNTTEVRKFNTSIKNKPISKEKRTGKQIMNEFFESLYDKMPYLCDNCNAPLKAFSNTAKKSACAHILPKSTFESIKINPDNILYLGAAYIGQCGCHDKWDANKDSRIKMKVYKQALIQFQRLIPHLSQKELNDALDYLGIEE